MDRACQVQSGRLKAADVSRTIESGFGAVLIGVKTNSRDASTVSKRQGSQAKHQGTSKEKYIRT